MLALSAPAIGALVGGALGLVLSAVVAAGEQRARRAGSASVRREYTSSLVVVPLALAGLGALAGLVLQALA